MFLKLNFTSKYIWGRIPGAFPQESHCVLICMFIFGFMGWIDDMVHASYIVVMQFIFWFMQVILWSMQVIFRFMQVNWRGITISWTQLSIWQKTEVASIWALTKYSKACGTPKDWRTNWVKNKPKSEMKVYF